MQNDPAPPPPSIWAELVKDLTDLDRGIVGTVRDLFVHPRRVLEGRLRYPNPEYFAPFKLLLLVGGAYALLANAVFDYDRQVEQSIASLKQSASGQEAEYWLGFFQQVMQWIRDYQSLLALAYVPAVAWLSRMAFRRQVPEFRAHAYAWAYTYSLYYLLSMVLLAGTWLLFPTLLTSTQAPSRPGAFPASELLGGLVGGLAFVAYGFFSGRLLGLPGFARRLGLALIAFAGSLVAGTVLAAVLAGVYVLIN